MDIKELLDVIKEAKMPTLKEDKVVLKKELGKLRSPEERKMLVNLLKQPKSVAGYMRTKLYGGDKVMKAIDAIKQHKALALGAAGTGVGATLAAKHELSENKKKSSMFDEAFVNEIADAILKQASNAEMSEDITAEDIITYLLDSNAPSEEVADAQSPEEKLANAIVEYLK